MPGRHNVQNALAAIGVAVEMGCDDDTIRTGFARFGGVRRRFTRVGEVAGATVIDDYAHHPVEIRAVLAAAREASRGRVIAVVQPHRFTRLRDLMRRVPDRASTTPTWSIVAPVYPAGEQPIAGVDSAAPGRGPARARPPLGERDRRAGRAAAELAQGLIKPGDFVVCLGAGDITKWAAGLAAAIAAQAGAGGMTGQIRAPARTRAARRARTTTAASTAGCRPTCAAS